MLYLDNIHLDNTNMSHTAVLHIDMGTVYVLCKVTDIQKKSCSPMFHVPTNTEMMSSSLCWLWVAFINCRSWQKASLFYKTDHIVAFPPNECNSTASIRLALSVKSIKLDHSSKSTLMNLQRLTRSCMTIMYTVCCCSAIKLQ